MEFSETEYVNTVSGGLIVGGGWRQSKNPVPSRPVESKDKELENQIQKYRDCVQKNYQKYLEATKHTFKVRNYAGAAAFGAIGVGGGNVVLKVLNVVKNVSPLTMAAGAVAGVVAQFGDDWRTEQNAMDDYYPGYRACIAQYPLVAKYIEQNIREPIRKQGYGVTYGWQEYIRERHRWEGLPPEVSLFPLTHFPSR